MKVSATLRDASISPQKVRLVAKALRGLPVAEVLEQLTYLQKKAAPILKKLLLSALANAENNYSLDIDTLVVDAILVDEAGILPLAKGLAGCTLP